MIPVRLTTFALLTLAACGSAPFSAGTPAGDSGADAGLDAAPETNPGDGAPATDAGSEADVAVTDAQLTDSTPDAPDCTPTAHPNGIGQTYLSCDPPGTYTRTTAMEACTAYARAIGDTAFNCSAPWNCSTGAMVCHSTSDEAGSAGLTCETYCWAYDGTAVGSVTGCTCPAVPKGTWQ